VYLPESSPPARGLEARQTVTLGDAQRLDDLPSGPVRDTDVAHVTVAHQLIERTHRLLDGRGGIEAMNLVQIDMLELQPPEARLHALENVVASGPAGVRALAHLAEHLGRDHHVVAWDFQILQRLTGDLFGGAGRVDVGGVDEVDAGIQRLTDQPFRIGLR
jgi:hypothetical protein